MQPNAEFTLTSSKPNNSNNRLFALRPATHWQALRSGSFRCEAARSLPQESVLRQATAPSRRRGPNAEAIAALLAAAESRDPGSEQHAFRVAARAELLGHRLGLSESDLAALVTAALVHDIGKLGVPESILAKPGPLTAAEYATIKRHPVIGESILRPLGGLDRVRSLVRHHHEWFDGRGYPDGLAGERIPLGARILQVADSIDAMLTPRSYKPGRTTVEVVAELKRCRGTQFDPQIADIAVDGLLR